MYFTYTEMLLIPDEGLQNIPAHAWRLYGIHAEEDPVYLKLHPFTISLRLLLKSLVAIQGSGSKDLILIRLGRISPVPHLQ